MTSALNLIRLAVLALTLLTTPHLFAQNSYEECLAQASTDLENSLCELRKLSRNSALPNMDDFKRNPPEIQVLLLKREAERYGLTLPSANASAPSTLTANTSTIHLASSTKERHLTAENRSEKKSASLSGCELRTDAIQCGKTHYELVRNKKNSQLRAEAFSSHNELVFAEKRDSVFKEQSDFRYLSAIYPVYIHKMLAIGLGDSTMSFTKFATLYWQSKHDENSFSARFRQIYNHLKIEKSRNQIQSRYSNAHPEDIGQCMRMDRDILICDNKTQNWVYKLK